MDGGGAGVTPPRGGGGFAVPGRGNGCGVGGCWASAAASNSTTKGMDRLYALKEFCSGEQDWLVETIEALVRLESPSTDKAAVDRCGQEIATRLQSIGARVTRLSRQDRGDHILAECGCGDRQVLLLGHFDTVWPVGQIERMPLKESEGRLHGPGIFDMKAGIGLSLLAARAILETGTALERRLVMLWTSDEEIGSDSSRAAIEDEARRSDAVLVIEPPLPDGGVKTSRKGVGEFGVEVRGIAAHAGLEPRRGASAIHELARQILKVRTLEDFDRGVTVNVGLISGGTRSNVVAEEARAVVDARAVTAADAERLTAALRALTPTDGRTRIAVSGGFSRPPMERTAGTARLYEQARGVAAGLGLPLTEGSAGGGSDGNFTAALGVPTLDGLGAVGDGAHASHEHIDLRSLPARAALLAGLIVQLGSASG